MKANKRRKPVRKKPKHHDRHQGETRCKDMYECIDGNFTYFPVAECTYHKGVLTRALMNTHQCRQKHCRRLVEGIDYE